MTEQAFGIIEKKLVSLPKIDNNEL